MSAALVAEVRAQYPARMSLEQCVKVCNEVAHKKGPGWGLHRKGGTSWNGIAIDIVLSPGGVTGYDILRDADGVGAPQWSATIAPAGGWQFEPVHPEWLPTSPPPPPPSGGDLEARVAALEAKMSQAGRIMAGG